MKVKKQVNATMLPENFCSDNIPSKFPCESMNILSIIVYNKTTET